MARGIYYSDCERKPTKNRAACHSTLPTLPQVPQCLQGVGLEAEPCLDLCVFLLPTLTTYVSNLGQGKWQSNTLCNAREQAGKAAIIPKMAHSLGTSSLNTKHLARFQWKVQEGMLPCQTLWKLDFSGSIASSILMTPYSNKGRLMLRCTAHGGKSICLCLYVHKRSQIFHTC